MGDVIASRLFTICGIVASLVATTRAPLASGAEARMLSVADTTALEEARRVVADIDRRRGAMRVATRDLPGSAREHARVTGYVERGTVRRVDVAYMGIAVHGFEAFWYRGDSVVLATRTIERLVPGSDSAVQARIEHQLFFRGDSVLRRTSAVTKGDGDAGSPPEGVEMRARSQGVRRCVLAAADDERACRGF